MNDKRQPQEDREERTRRFLHAPNRMKGIANHIMMGGSLTDYCKDNDVRYCDVRDWISADSTRKTICEDAFQAREEWMYGPISCLLAVFNNYQTWAQKCREFHDEHLYPKNVPNS